MSVERDIAEAVRQVVREEVEPLRRELADLRRERDPDAVSIREAARLMSVSTRTIQRRIESGALTAVRVGRVVRVSLAEVGVPHGATMGQR